MVSAVLFPRLLSPTADTAIRVDERDVSWEALSAHVASYIAWLSLRNVKAGHRVVVFTQDALTTVVALVGNALAGVTSVPVDASLPRYVRQERIAQVAPRLLVAAWPARIDTPGICGLAGLDASDVGPRLAKIGNLADDTLTLLMKREGNRPVALSRTALVACTDVLATEWSWRPTDTAVHAAPLSDLGGLVVMLASLHVGGALRWVIEPDSSRLAEAITEGALLIADPDTLEIASRQPWFASARGRARLTIDTSIDPSRVARSIVAPRAANCESLGGMLVEAPWQREPVGPHRHGDFWAPMEAEPPPWETPWEGQMLIPLVRVRTISVPQEWVPDCPPALGETEVHLPLRILVVGEFSRRTDPRPPGERPLTRLVPANLGAAFTALAPAIELTLAARHPLEGELKTSLSFSSLADFDPGSIAARAPELRERLDEVLCIPALLRLEAAWRSLDFLLERCGVDSRVVVDVLDCTKDDLDIDFEDAVEVGRSGLFRKVYSDVYAVRGGSPFGLIVGDYEFGPGPRDVALLRAIAQVAALAHAPFVAACAPSMFGVDRWDDLAAEADLAAASEHAPWDALRRSPESRHLCLCLPRFRLHPRRVVWGSAAFAFAARAAESFCLSNWCVNIVGRHRLAGGLIEFPCLVEGAAPTPDPLECELPEERERKFRACGVTVLTLHEDSGNGCFLAASSCHRPTHPDSRVERSPIDPSDFFRHDSDDDARKRAAQDAAINAQLPFLLMAARFAQFIKLVYREGGGGARTRDEIFPVLWEHIRFYENDYPDPNLSSAFRRPIKHFRFDVTPDDSEGWCRFTMRLRMAFRLQGITHFTLTVVGRL